MNRLRLLAATAAVTLALPLGAFHPQWVSKSSVPLQATSTLASGDFDEDGLTDFVSRRSDETVHVILTQAGGTLAAPVQVAQPGTDLGNGVVVGDATGDGHLDVILSDLPQPSLIVLPGNGDGTFGTAIVSTVASGPNDIANGDFNEDGKLDLAVRSTAATSLAIYAGDGAGHFSHVVTIALGSSASLIETGDVDHDGFDDVAIGYGISVPARIYFGNGDGTFDAPVELASPGMQVSRMLLADLDNDDDLEVLYSHFNAEKVTVAVNGGARTFAAPVAYPTRGGPNPYGSPLDLVSADIDGDGKRDVVVTLANAREISTLRGNGDGTLSAPYTVSSSFTGDGPRYLAIAELTSDARPDLVLASTYAVTLYQNRLGDVDVTVTSDYPTVSEGQPVQFEIWVRALSSSANPPAPKPEGTVTLKRDGVEIGTGQLSADGLPITIEVASLPAGTHAITVAFPGDDEYVATESAPLSQRVVAEVTTVALSSNAPTIEYRQSLAITAQVSSPLPQPLGGTITFHRDGVHQVASLAAPQATWYAYELAPGTYQFQARYSGNDDQPPSTSANLTQVVTKASTATEIDGAPVFRRFSAQGSLYLEASALSHSIATSQKVKLYEGTTLRGEVNGPRGSVSLSLPVGVHYLHATFDGDGNYAPSRSPLFRYEVVPDQGVYLDARADGTTIRVQTRGNNSGNYFKLYRRIGNGPWEWFAAAGGAREELNVPPNVVYAYRVEEYTWSTDQFLGSSNTDLAMVTNFTDDPLFPGMRVKTPHVTELLAATNALLTATGGSPLVLTGVASGQPMRAQHLLMLRGAINQGRGSLGVTSAQWTNVVEPGRPIRAFDLVELREALR